MSEIFIAFVTLAIFFVILYLVGWFIDWAEGGR